MPYCRLPLEFSRAHSQSRIEKASGTLGEAVVKRILACALFLLGARRQDISQHLAIPLGTLFSLLTRIGRAGLPALEDRRRKDSGLLPPPTPQELSFEVSSEPCELVLKIGDGALQLRIPHQNPLQAKTVLLTLLQNGWLPCSQVARHLQYSSTHTARISRQLAQDDVGALLDKRTGQQQDYRVTSEIKAELIQQFVLDLMTAGRTSGNTLAEGLKERCGLSVPARTVRHHLAEMGLSKIKHSLPELVAAVKKTPETDPQHAGPAAGPDRV
jgi:hypothetical protein